MAIPEGLNTMPEELELPEQTSGLVEPLTSPVAQSPSIKARMRKYLAPAAAALGIATGVLYSADTTPIAAAPVGETATPNGPSAFDAVDTVFLPRLDTGSNIHATPGTPVGPGETATPTATNSPEPSATNTPVIPPTETPTPTSSATPTETATPTEQGPLHELPLPLGARVAIPAGPSLGDANSFKNGDRDSGAAVAGLSFDNLEDPFRDGNYVVGDISYPGDDPDTIHVTEQRHTQTVLVPVDQVDPEKLERVRAFNPETDKKPGYTVSFWNGTKGEYTFLGNGANDGSPLTRDSFIADFTKQDGLVRLNGYATGSNKGAYAYIMSWDDVARNANFLAMKWDITGGQWVISNKTIDYNLVNKGDMDNVIDNEQEEVRRKEEIGALMASDWGDVVYRFNKGAQDISFLLSEDSITVPGQTSPIPLPYGPKSYLNHFVRTAGDGSRQPNTTLHIKRMDISFDKLDGATLRETPETALPSLADLTKQAGLTVVIPVEGFGGQPDAVSLLRQTGHVMNFNDPYSGNNERQGAFFRDQGDQVFDLLEAGTSQTDLIARIRTSQPGTIFQLSPIGGDNGPSGGWFDSMGKLTVSQEKLNTLAEAAKEVGVTLAIDVNVPLDLSGSQPDSRKPLPMDNVLTVANNLVKNVPNPPVVFAFSGREKDYSSQAQTDGITDQMSTALNRVQDVGVGSGLANIEGNATTGIQWFGKVGKALYKSGSNIAILSFSRYTGTNTDPITIFKSQAVTGHDPHDAFRHTRYSDAEGALKRSTIDFLTEKQQGALGR